MTMTYTEALRKSRGLNKTAALPELEGWQRAGIGGLGGGLLTAGLTSLVAPKASTKSKLLAALIGAGGGAAAGYRYLPGYGASKDVAEAPASAPAEEKPDAAAASATPAASGGETKGEDKDKDKREAPTGKPSPDAPSGGGRPDGGGDGGGNDDGGGVGLRELLGGAAAVEGGRRLWKKYRAGRSGGSGGNGPGASGSGSLPGTGPTPLLGGPSGSGSPSSGSPSGSGPALLPGSQSASTSRDRKDVTRAGEDMPAAGRARASARASRESIPLNRMSPETAERVLFDMAQGFDPSIPREVQLKALQSAYRRNLELSSGPIGGEKFWVTRISSRIRQKAIEALKASDPQFKDRLREDIGQRGYEVYRTDRSYIPVIDRRGKYSLRKLGPFETLDPLTAASQDDLNRRNAIMKGTPDVWNAKHYGGRLRPSKLYGAIGGWVPEMAPDAPKSVRAARLARAVNIGSRLLPILLRTLDD